MTVAVRRCTYAELEAAPGFAALLEGYADEAALNPEWKANPQGGMYEAMEGSGALHIFGAFDDEMLVGFILVLVSVLPHFGRRAAVIESFFVAKEARRTGAGLMLLRRAERLSEEMTAEGLFVSAPTGGVLADVLEGTEYRETSRIFFKEVRRA